MQPICFALTCSSHACRRSEEVRADAIVVVVSVVVMMVVVVVMVVNV